MFIRKKSNNQRGRGRKRLKKRLEPGSRGGGEIIPFSKKKGWGEQFEKSIMWEKGGEGEDSHCFTLNQSLENEDAETPGKGGGSGGPAARTRPDNSKGWGESSRRNGDGDMDRSHVDKWGENWLDEKRGTRSLLVGGGGVKKEDRH